jgi:NAD(P) transhydrogenase subunit alpha
MFSKNLRNFLFHLLDKEGRLAPDFDDEIVRGALVTRGGEVVHPRVREALGGA